MRKFEVTLTYKRVLVPSSSPEEVMIKQQKIFNTELDDESCISPEIFCDKVINCNERHNVVRLNIKELSAGNTKPLYWLNENRGRIYLYNGVAIVLNRN